MSILFPKKNIEEETARAAETASAAPAEQTPVEQTEAVQPSEAPAASVSAAETTAAASANVAEATPTQTNVTTAETPAETSATMAATAAEKTAPAPPVQESAPAAPKGPTDALIARRTVAERHSADGDAAKTSGEPEAAYTDYKKAAEVYEELVAMGGGAAEDREALAGLYRTLHKLCYQLNVHYTELSAEAMRNMAAMSGDEEKQEQFRELIDKHSRTAKQYLSASGQYDRKLRSLKES